MDKKTPTTLQPWEIPTHELLRRLMLAVPPDSTYLVETLQARLMDAGAALHGVNDTATYKLLQEQIESLLTADRQLRDHYETLRDELRKSERQTVSHPSTPGPKV